MAKGGGRGKGRPRKVDILAQPEIHRGILEIGESSSGVGSDVTMSVTESGVESVPTEIQTNEAPKTKEMEDTLSNHSTESHVEAPMRSKGMKLGYVAPIIKQGNPTACLVQSELEKESVKWKKAVILYVIGESPTIAYLTAFLCKQCMVEQHFEIFYHGDDYFVVLFESMEDREKLLYAGPHTIANRPVIVKEWVMNFDFEKEILKVIPLWVQLPNLPLNCWSMDSLSRIGSVLGNRCVLMSVLYFRKELLTLGC